MTSVDGTTVHELLISLVRDELETMTPIERLVFFNRTTAGYCLECGEAEPHEVCGHMVDNGKRENP